MHQVEKFQSYFRLATNKPELEEAYIPIPYSRYIVIFNDGFIQANDYSYFTDVVEYLKSADPNINVVQVINSPNVERIPNAYHVQELSHSNLFFIIRNADLVVSSEPLCTEVAGIYDKPLVRISGNSPPGAARPYFFNADVHSTICTEDQPSYSAIEEDKKINKIPPEGIARLVLKKLDIKDPTPLYKTLYTGSLYRQYMVDYIPNFTMSHNISGGQPITARMDVEDNFDALREVCSHSNVDTVCLDKEVDIESLASIKDKVNSIAIEINMDFSIDFIKEVHKLGCKVILYTKDEKNLKEIRLNFIDWIVNFIESKDKPDLPKSKQLFYKSTRLTLSNNKKFTSLAASRGNIDNNKIIDSKTFWEESDHFLIYSLD
tara:strand:- start:666 stop:1793 length:1128 start_codon:yes stop_codon:yes gene_type:complete